MKFGTLHGVRETLGQLHSMLPSGRFTFQGTEGQKINIKLSDSVSLELPNPFVADIENQAGVLVVKFQKPYPVGTYRFVQKQVSFVQATVERIDLGLEWAPDGWLEVQS